MTDKQTAKLMLYTRRCLQLGPATWLSGCTSLLQRTAAPTPSSPSHRQATVEPRPPLSTASNKLPPQLTLMTLTPTCSSPTQIQRQTARGIRIWGTLGSGGIDCGAFVATAANWASFWTFPPACPRNIA